MATWYGNLYYRTNGTDPAYIIRLAELYLIRAEARASLPVPDISGSREDLNKVRNRAGLASLSINTAAELLTAIENENRYEFAFENHRWYDLVRTGRAQAVLGITDANKLLLPIPYAQILVDGSLTQNPGYGN
ncbi:RagB/SusD family nutrient uptake outer membrane protein [Niabella sp. W65]|nr:RagB/SusD family nutrient uptake outer membrane protein [Niabella sp. W65]MCH7363824.1 RagB/SusD family nutrient uptake outer membrane protein [Niabella sp. W65]ULT46461.1 RagB/SusD family nutrient uptake outer membrane protein [Niabella sp. I65]